MFRKAVRSINGVTDMVELQCGVVDEQTVDGKEPPIEVSFKPYSRQQRRLRTRRVHRDREVTTKLLEHRANAHTRRAKKARRRGQFSSALSGAAEGLREKALGVSRRFHVPIVISTGAECNDNGEE